ncbi:MAG: hypothetical protein M3P30_12905 [Chloroflexota bacterium]|nr:hypothetical protein [Chloroflexota bacterium]
MKTTAVQKIPHTRAAMIAVCRPNCTRERSPAPMSRATTAVEPTSIRQRSRQGDPEQKRPDADRCESVRADIVPNERGVDAAEYRNRQPLDDDRPRHAEDRARDAGAGEVEGCDVRRGHWCFGCCHANLIVIGVGSG